MSRLGSIAHARTIAAYRPDQVAIKYSDLVTKNEYVYEYLWDVWNAPEGFEFLGAGWSRMVFQGPDGVAYKVPKNRHGRDANNREATTRSSWWKALKAKGVHMPRCRYFKSVGVSAMELCVKTAEADYQFQRVIEGITGLGDMHEENVYVDQKGRVVVVDFAQ